MALTVAPCKDEEDDEGVEVGALGELPPHPAPIARTTARAVQIRWCTNRGVANGVLHKMAKTGGIFAIDPGADYKVGGAVTECVEALTTTR